MSDWRNYPVAQAFPPTRLSVIERIRDAQDQVRIGAFGEVVEGYWKPVYKHLRLKWQLSPEDAEDLTQSFFAEAIEKAWLQAYDPAKARFRTFVRVCADRFVMNWRQAARRLKRGGAGTTLSLDFPGAETELLKSGVSTPADVDEVFRHEFVRAVFQSAVEAVREECESDGRLVPFQLFVRYDLDPPEGVSYASLASDFGLSSSQVTNQLARVRGSFRRHVLDALRTLNGSEEHFRADARELLGLEIE